MHNSTQVTEKTNNYFERLLTQEDEFSGAGCLDAKPIRMFTQLGVLDGLTPADLTAIMHEASLMQDVRAKVEAFRKRDDNDNGFSKNQSKDALETLELIEAEISD